jgi:DNA-binding response OmpR family regulator
VALTASAFESERERCLAAGMTEYLTKPIGRRDLLACLERHLGAGGVRPDAGAPAPAPAEPGEVFDVEHTLDRIGGNTALLHRLVAIFRRQTPALLRELEHGYVAAATGGRVRDRPQCGSLRSIGGRAAAVAAALGGRRRRRARTLRRRSPPLRA